MYSVSHIHIQMTPVAVNERDYLTCNQALARLLVVVSKNQPVSTRRLLQLLKSTSYGQITIRLAEKRAFIQRKRVKTGGVGQPALMITLTTEGKRLAKFARALR
jgi:hypothetical protein